MNVYASTIALKGEDIHFHHTISSSHIIVGVADGHGGATAAQLCKDRIANIFVTHADKHVECAIKATFEDLHRECCNLPCCSGCTLTVAIVDLHNGNYTCGNVGDSHAIHLKFSTHIWITTSHRLQDNLSERRRHWQNVSYLSNNTQHPVGPPRLFPGGLTCSRAIGDADCKHVSCEPSVCSDIIKEGDALVLCTDGVWDTAPVKKITQVTRDTMNPDFLCRLATKFGVNDDATAVIVTREKRKTSLHVGLFKLFDRTGSSSSFSSEEEVTSPTTLKVPV
jgi:serine/threonine protein phosphatase PrpC